MTAEPFMERQLSTEITPLTVAAGVIAHDTSKRVLGPTADLVGQDIAKAYEFAKSNISRVIRIADQKLGKNANEAGGVHPRIARRVLREAQDIEDVFAAEYFGGILASSRGKDSEDDSAVPFLKTIETLSSRQLQLHFVAHYLFGKAVGRLSAEKHERYLLRYGLKIDLDFLSELYDGVDFSWQLADDIQQLSAVDAIGVGFSIRTPERTLGRKHQQLTQQGLYVTFCSKGVRLFLRSLGLRRGDPTLLPIVDIDYSVSSELRPQLLSKGSGHLFKNPFCDASTELAADIEEVRSESEDKIDELKSEIESLESRVDELSETIAELRSSNDEDAPSGQE